MKVYVANPNKRKTAYDILNIFYQKEQIIFTKDQAEVLIGDDFLVLGGEKIPYQDNLDLKVKLYTYLVNKTSYKSPWGILTGSKPSKLLQKYSLDQVREKYLISEEKLEILEEVARIQAMEDFDPKAWNLYINIPFCPTRCDYCSYPTIVGSHIDKSAYVDYLLREIDQVNLPKSLDTIYIGGGTPSFLSHKDLERLLGKVKNKFTFREFTLEAGREDSLDFEKLEIFRAHGVDRISLNPQSFTENVIRMTGRNQDLDHFFRLFDKAYDLGFIINMDFILGLFGESRDTFRDNFTILKDLLPHNLTFHALAQKVGSKYHEANVLGSKKDSLLISEDIHKFTSEYSYKSYYLYRQKNIISNLENIGYQRGDTPSRYNILINEELENIIGLGMNANSKLMNKAKYRNPKNLRDYYENIDKTIEEKNKIIGKFLKNT